MERATYFLLLTAASFAFACLGENTIGRAACVFAGVIDAGFFIEEIKKRH